MLTGRLCCLGRRGGNLLMDKKRGDDPVYLLYLRDKSRECWYSGQGRWMTEDPSWRLDATFVAV